MSEKLILPYPVSANRYWRMGKFGVYATKEARNYKLIVWERCRLGGYHPSRSPVALTVELFPKGKRVMDLDNCLKITLDALQGGAYCNDNQVEEIHAYKRKPDGDARLEVEVKYIEA